MDETEFNHLVAAMMWKYNLSTAIITDEELVAIPALDIVSWRDEASMLYHIRLEPRKS